MPRKSDSSLINRECESSLFSSAGTMPSDDTGLIWRFSDGCWGGVAPSVMKNMC